MNKFIYTTLGAILFFTTSLFAQSNLRIPLSNPSESGTLEINVLFADEITVRTHAENEVHILYDGDGVREDRREEKDGMRRITPGGAGLEVTEKENRVIIKSGPMPNDLELLVLVPQNFSLSLHSTSGDVTVDGLSGEIEINSINGDVEVTNISGSVVLNSVNGDTEIEFAQISPDTPMSFTGTNGDIEVTFPANAAFSAKMKTDWGDIYTNFDMQIDNTIGDTENTNEGDTYRVSINKWVVGHVNGGGAEFVFKTLKGDITIRKKE